MEHLRQRLRSAEAGRGIRHYGVASGRRLAGRMPLLIGSAIVILTLSLARTVDVSVAIAGALAVVAVAATLPEPAGRPHSRISGAPDPSEPHDGHVSAGVGTWDALLYAMPDAALVIDGASVVLYANGHARDLFPMLRPGGPINHVVRHPDLVAAIDKARASNAPLLIHLVESFPVERRISVSLGRVAIGPARPRFPDLLLTFRDVSEQHRLAQMRADFVANASHELRTPLASLRGFVETLQGPARDDSAARQRFLSLMATQAERMSRLIDDLLSLSRVEMRVHLTPHGKVDLDEVVAHVGQVLAPIAAAAKVTLVVEPLGEPAPVRGDRDELVQVVQNLAHNALKYGFEGGRVVIALQRRPGNATTPRFAVVVADDGPGIAPAHLPRLTERFYRVNVASSRDKGGTGLGLAIVKHIVTRHRGELRIESAVGKGSTFTVILDAAP